MGTGTAIHACSRAFVRPCVRASAGLWDCAQSFHARTLARRRARTNLAFTMLELLTVITLLGILMAIAVPTLAESGRAASVKRAAREMASLLRWARATAVLSEIEVEMRIDPDEGLYQLVFDLSDLVRAQAERAERSGRQARAARRQERDIEEEMEPWLELHELPSDVHGPLVRFLSVETEMQVQSRSSRRISVPTIVFFPDGTCTPGSILLASRTGAEMRIEMLTATGLAIVRDPRELYRQRLEAEGETP
jgi:general secretion pathway protein H